MKSEPKSLQDYQRIRKEQGTKLRSNMREVITELGLNRKSAIMVKDHNRPDYDTKPKTTIHDVLQAIGRSTGKRFKRRSRISAVLADAGQGLSVSQEVKDSYRNTSFASPLTSEVKEKLRSDVINRTKSSSEAELFRNAKLDALARAWVHAWLAR